MAGRAKTPEEIVENLLLKSVFNRKTECWECHLQPTMIRPGYFKHYVMVGGRGGKRIRVSRLVYAITHKQEIPEGLGVLHTCDNPLCIRPEHLFLGTAQDNTDDMITKGRKIDDPEVGQRRREATTNLIRPLLEQGLNCHDIANRLGLSYNTVRGYKDSLAVPSGD